jgi:hypothetical protein
VAFCVARHWVMQLCEAFPSYLVPRGPQGPLDFLISAFLPMLGKDLGLERTITADGDEIDRSAALGLRRPNSHALTMITDRSHQNA